MCPGKTYDLGLVVTGKDVGATKVLEDVNQGIDGLDAGAQKAGGGLSLLDGVMVGLGGKLVELAAQLPAMAMELVNVGAQAEAVKHRFTAFAGGTDEAAKYLDAFQAATDGTTSKMAAMEGAAKLLQMGLVENTDEMGAVAAMATKLGDQTADAGDRISDFALMLANQSVPRLDNFGISSGRVRARIDELIKSGQAAGREEAFKMAVMEEGAVALEKLGDTSDLAITKMDKLKAAGEDVKMGLGEMFSDLAMAALDAVGGIDKVTESIRSIPSKAEEIGGTVEKLKQLQVAGTAALTAWMQGKDAGDAFNQSIWEQTGVLEAQAQAQKESVRAISEYMAPVDQAARATDRIKQSQEEARIALENLANTASTDASEGMTQLSERTFELENDMRASQVALREEAAELQALAEAAAETALKVGEVTLDLTLSWTDYFNRQAEAEATWAAEQEAFEAEHRAILLEAQQAGNLEAVQAEMARYDEEKAVRAAAYAEQEAAQRESLGRMVLQSFESWAQMKGISAEEMLNMRTAIAEEYGLIDAETAATVTNLVGQWEAWADSADISTSDVIASMDETIQKHSAMQADAATIEDSMALSSEDYYAGRVTTADESMATMQERSSTFYADEETAQTDHLTTIKESEATYHEDVLAAKDEFIANVTDAETTYREDAETATQDHLDTLKTSTTDAYTQMYEEVDVLLQEMYQATQASLGDMETATQQWAATVEAGTNDVGASLADASEATERAEDRMTRAMGDAARGIASSCDAIKGAMDGVASKAGGLKNALDSIPRNITVRVNVEQSGGVPQFQRGGFAPGGLAVVGEGGPELVALPKGGWVYSHQQSRGIADMMRVRGWRVPGFQAGGAVNPILIPGVSWEPIVVPGVSEPSEPIVVPGVSEPGPLERLRAPERLTAPVAGIAAPVVQPTEPRSWSLMVAQEQVWQQQKQQAQQQAKRRKRARQQASAAATPALSNVDMIVRQQAQGIRWEEPLGEDGYGWPMGGLGMLFGGGTRAEMFAGFSGRTAAMMGGVNIVNIYGPIHIHEVNNARSLIMELQSLAGR